MFHAKRLYVPRSAAVCCNFVYIKINIHSKTVHGVALFASQNWETFSLNLKTPTGNLCSILSIISLQATPLSAVRYQGNGKITNIRMSIHKLLHIRCLSTMLNVAARFSGTTGYFATVQLLLVCKKKNQTLPNSRDLKRDGGVLGT